MTASRPLPKEKGRTLPRLNKRNSGGHAHGDEFEHLWAVSYADLLMVLVSFFVVFFLFDTDKQCAAGLQAIALGIQGKEVNAGSMIENSSPKEIGLLKRELEESGASKVAVNGDQMLLMLPDNVFELREFKLTPETEERLSMIYKVIQPFERDLDVVVMGHSDSMRFAKAKNEYLGNNFDLSSLRALRALQYMLAQGFPQEQISAQGAADGIRNSRTLSIKITWKEARLK